FGDDCEQLAAGELRVEHGTQLSGLIADAVDLFPCELQRLGVLSREELQWEDAHADKVGAMNALVAFGNDEADAEQTRALGRPIPRRTRPIFFARENAEWRTALRVLDGGVVDAHAGAL